MQTAARPTHLDEIVCREPTHLGFCDASGINAGDVWLDSSRSVPSIMWYHPCLPDIIMALVLVTNPGGALTNYDLDITFLFLHEVTLLEVCPDAKIVHSPLRII